MAWATCIVKGVLTDFPTPILPNIDGEQTGEDLIYLHRLISINAATVASNIGGNWHGHHTMTMTYKEYMTQTGYASVPPKIEAIPTNVGNHQKASDLT